MAKIHKLTKNGQTIYPATTTDAVVDANTKKSISELLGSYSVIAKMDGKFYNPGSGLLQAGDTYTGTSIFSVLPNRKYQLLNYGSATQVIYFDSSKKRISNANISIDTAKGIFETTENTSFIAITSPISNNINVFYLIDIDYKNSALFYLDFETDPNTTRNKIYFSLRKHGLIISYKFEEEWIVEQFIGTASYLNDSAWGADNNWNRIATVKDLPDTSSFSNVSQVYIQKKMDGKFYNAGTGNLQTGTGNTGTPMFPVIPGHIYSVYDYSIFSSRQFIWFNNSKKRISNTNIQSDKITAPANAVFAALTFDATTVWDNIIITDVTDIENLDDNS